MTALEQAPDVRRPGPPPSRPRRRWRPVRVAVIGGALLVAAAGATAWYLLDDDAPPPPALSAAASDERAAAAGDPGIEGQWTVAAAEDTYVGYRVDEVLVGLNKTAVGRTPAVTGRFSVSGSTIDTATFTAQVARLTSDQDHRDERMRTDGLETDRFPEATFVLTDPIELPSEVAIGEPFTVTAAGDLTLHGVTRSVEIELDAQRQDHAAAMVVGTLPIRFADYDIRKPDIAGVVTTEDHGVLELSLRFTRAD